MKSFAEKTTISGPINSSSGFTLAEILVAVVVITVALVPLITVMGQGVKRSKDPQRITVANMLAQDLMEEIMCKKFDEDPTNPDTTARLGPDSLESRSGNPTSRNYDDVDDYDGFNETPPKEVDNTTMTEYTGFRRRVIVDYVSETNLDTISTAITRFKRVSVTVSWENDTQSVVLRAIKGNY
ncbi:MAG: prepilin-type N-terminal cleavage/methylation domain-containing protein [bacterium]|jgi:MSHA pilin protein MshD|nr:prepilin-type N-terminal cleavage/methylation domain-containing protein [bacterium]